MSGIIRIKKGVVIASLTDTGILEPVLVQQQIWDEMGWGDVWITSCIDGNHSDTSFHYVANKRQGQGIDSRLPPNPYKNKMKALGMIRARLPKKWSVILEKDHFHFQPSRFWTGTL